MDIPTSTTEEASVFDSRPDRDWLNPIAMSMLQGAVRKRADEVVLGGVRYSIEYGFKLTYPVSGEVSESVRLRRMDGGFVPFGYISLKRIKRFNFERGE